jgi:GntR family transcriptional regulator / MocR family aminotransferase
VQDIPLIDLNIDPQASDALFVQIYEALRRRIVSAQLLPGARLPPSRKLADELGVSRSTIITVYEQLSAEGFTHSRAGSGIFVSDIGEVEQLAAKTPHHLPAHTAPTESRALKPFHPGNPDPRLFPYRQWARHIAQVARTEPEALVRSHDTFGDAVLRQAISRYLLEWRGLPTDTGQILITAGASEALELCIRTLIKPQQQILLEDPCYPPLRAFVENMRIPITELAMDEQGAQAPENTNDKSDAGLVILTPSSQFPLGGPLPQARRNAFIAWAQQNNAWIIEDDYDSEFRYAGRPIPSLASLDTQQRTLYIGSFSKIFSHGLRMGFIAVPAGLVADFSDSLRRFGSKASIMPQRPLGLFMQNGGFYRHIRRVRRIYAERRQVFINLLQTHLGELVTYDDHKAGMHIAVKLPDVLNDTKISKKLAQHGITCHPLSSYYASSSAQNGLLMGFCSFTESEMEQAMRKLKQVIDA